jgi:hypothetical protein
LLDSSIQKFAIFATGNVEPTPHNEMKKSFDSTATKLEFDGITSLQFDTLLTILEGPQTCLSQLVIFTSILNDRNVCALFEALGKSKITHFRLSDNRIHPNGMSFLSRILPQLVVSFFSPFQ